MHNVLSLILGGGRGTRLYPLTKLRSKPAVPVAGKYRLIDIPISNCINSGLNRIFVLTQFLSVSLHRHIANTYKFDPFSRGFVEVLAAQQTNEAADWYQGTADAVRQQIRYVAEDPCDEVLILSGDQLYRMDFQQLLETHRETQADVTIAVLPVPRNQVAGFGIVRVRRRWARHRLRRETEDRRSSRPVLHAARMDRAARHPERRPALSGQHGHLPLQPRRRCWNCSTPSPWRPTSARRSFRAASLTHASRRISSTATGKTWARSRPITRRTWPWPATIPPFDFHSPEGVIYTRMRFLPASRISAAKLSSNASSATAASSRKERASNARVIGVRSRIGRNVTLRDTVLIGADRFETDAERAANERTRRARLSSSATGPSSSARFWTRIAVSAKTPS